jgi:hypothetical protein
MSIEINELIVNATLEEGATGNNHQVKNHQFSDFEKMKAQIICDLKELFYELLDKQGER